MTDPGILYLEDFEEGQEHRTGTYTVSEEEILTFARHYDPQYFHIDPIAAKSSHFGGLIASGWHTCSIMMRLIVDQFLAKSSSMGSPGVDEIHWLIPVRPGDTLVTLIRVDKVRPSRSKPDRGLVHTTYTTLNQRDEIVMTMKALSFFGKRSAS